MVIAGLNLPDEFITGYSESTNANTYTDGRGRVSYKWTSPKEISISAIIPAYYDKQCFFDWFKFKPTKTQPMTKDVYCITSITKSLTPESRELELSISLAECVNLQTIGKNKGTIRAINNNEVLIDTTDKLKIANSNTLRALKKINDKEVLSVAQTKEGIHALFSNDNVSIREVTKSWRNSSLKEILNELGFDCEYSYKIGYYSSIGLTNLEIARALTPTLFKVGKTFKRIGELREVNVLDIVQDEVRNKTGYTMFAGNKVYSTKDGVDLYSFPFTTSENLNELCKFRSTLNERVLTIQTDTQGLNEGDLFSFLNGDEYLTVVILDIIRDDLVYNLRCGVYV